MGERVNGDNAEGKMVHQLSVIKMCLNLVYWIIIKSICQCQTYSKP